MRRSAAMLAMAAALAAADSPARAQAIPADGQVMKIDEPAGKITLKHGPIRNLDMGPMTMVFRVKDTAILKTIRVGDKVTFEAERVDGAITVTKMQKTP